MQKLTDLTKDQLIDLIIREREQNTFFEDAARYRYIRWPNAQLISLGDGNIPNEEELDDAVDEAIAKEGFNTHGVTLGGWQPIESAPRDGSDLLVYSPNGWGIVVAMWLEADGHWYTGLDDYVDVSNFNPTHWMSLPEPPR